jgi:Rrf2 family protein
MPVLSRKVRYALHGLGFIAAFSKDKPLPSEEILSYLRSYSPKTALSAGYIAKILQEVSRLGFTVAVTGPRGGYRLARPAEEIGILEVVEALDGPQTSGECLLSVGGCPRQENCGFRGVIQDAERAFYGSLAKVTIATIAEKTDFSDIPEDGGTDLLQSRTYIS